VVDGVRGQRSAHALSAVRELAGAHGVAGVVLTRPGAVAWASGGMNPPVDRTAATDVVWLCVGPDRAIIVTTEIEAPRILAEMDPAAYGIDVVGVPWWDGGAAVTASKRALGAAAGSTRGAHGLGSDGHPGFEVDLTGAITAARLALCPAERDELQALGCDAAEAVQDALRAWTPGESDRQIQGRIAGIIEAKGADCPVLLVGADERLGRFRHPLAIGAPAHRVVMAVLVARRSGMHVALTRYATAGALDPQLADGLSRTRRIHRKVLAACVPGATYGSVLDVLDKAYVDEGHPGAWQQHYQGGPIGYAQREFEIAPVQHDSPWWNHPVASGTAVAWNPSLPGGSKDEDTYLVGPDGATQAVTVAIDWPTADDQSPERPGVLTVGA
jgi:Xaa-Pro dipeptidase